MGIASKWHRFGELLGKSRRTIREYGFGQFFRKTYVRGMKFFFRHFVAPFDDPARRRGDHVDSVSEVIGKAFPTLQPLLVFRSPDRKRSGCLNFVTDALGSSLLGGVGTALILASQYAVKRNMTLRIITREEPAGARGYYRFMELMREKPPKKVLFWSDCCRSDLGNHRHPLEISDADEFFTTSWWTTAAVRAADTGCRIFYLIQETEDFFYPFGDMRLWCSWQMNCPDVRYIVNSHWLWEYFQEKYPVICANGTWFEPAFPRFLYQPSAASAAADRHKLFFYARPNHSRNLYFTGLKVLDEAFARGILDPGKWEVYLAGDACGKVEFSGGAQPVYLGRMQWSEYARFLGGVDVTFSLMYTPHPSYPPLDSLASGGVCVTNSFANKTDCPYCRNIIFRELNIDSLCDGLREGVKLALDLPARRRNFEELSLPADWSETLKGTIDFMENFG